MPLGSIQHSQSTSTPMLTTSFCLLGRSAQTSRDQKMRTMLLRSFFMPGISSLKSLPVTVVVGLSSLRRDSMHKTSLLECLLTLAVAILPIPMSLNSCNRLRSCPVRSLQLTLRH